MTIKADQNKVALSVSDTLDVSDIPIKTSLNMVASFTPDISDVTDSTSSNIKMLAGVSTDEQNHMHLTYLTHMARPQTYSLTQNKNVREIAMIVRMSSRDNTEIKNRKVQEKEREEHKIHIRTSLGAILRG